MKYIKLNPIFVTINGASGTCLDNFLPYLFELSCLDKLSFDVRGGIFCGFELKDLLLNTASEKYGIHIWGHSGEPHMDSLYVCHDPYTTVIPIMLLTFGLREHSD